MALRGLVGFLLVLAIALSFGNYIFLNFTDYDTGKQFFPGMIAEQVEKESSEDSLRRAETYVRRECEDKESVELNITREPLDIDCSQVDEISFRALLSNSIYDAIYYKEYDCGFFSCFAETETFPALIARQSREKYRTYHWFLIITDIILAVLLFLVSEGWVRKASAFGYVFLISGIGILPSVAIQEIFTSAGFFRNLVYIQVAMLVLGIALLALAVIFNRKQKEVQYKNAEDNSGNR